MPPPIDLCSLDYRPSPSNSLDLLGYEITHYAGFCMPPGVSARRATDPAKMTGKITSTGMSDGEIMTPTELEASGVCVFMRLSLVGEDMIRYVLMAYRMQ